MIQCSKYEETASRLVLYGPRLSTFENGAYFEPMTPFLNIMSMGEWHGWLYGHLRLKVISLIKVEPIGDDTYCEGFYVGLRLFSSYVARFYSTNVSESPPVLYAADPSTAALYGSVFHPGLDYFHFHFKKSSAQALLMTIETLGFVIAKKAEKT